MTVFYARFEVIKMFLTPYRGRGLYIFSQLSVVPKTQTDSDEYEWSTEEQVGEVQIHQRRQQVRHTAHLQDDTSPPACFTVQQRRHAVIDNGVSALLTSFTDEKKSAAHLAHCMCRHVPIPVVPSHLFPLNQSSHLPAHVDAAAH